MVKEAVAKRILQLCDERGITPNALANTAGMDRSTLYSVLGSKSNNPGIVTIKKICDGLDLSLADFFDAEIFKNLEQEIQ
jgi:transcriptional regulator with XRE-family HTH domain